MTAQGGMQYHQRDHGRTVAKCYLNSKIFKDRKIVQYTKQNLIEVG